VPRLSGKTAQHHAGAGRAQADPVSAEARVADAEFPVLYEAVVCSPVAPMHSEPRVATQMISQQLAGHYVEVLDEEGDWLRARGADRYEGWMHKGFLARAERELNSAARSLDGDRVSLGCVSRTHAGVARALPLAALLSPEEVVESGEVIETASVAGRFPREPAAVARTALERFMGTSYLWGGVTPWGADCSGLVQTSFALHGVQLPRDAWQQAELGRDAGSDVGELVAGDVLFFTDREDRRITHVGIALGNRQMVHLALGRGGYAVERLSDRRDPYVQRLRERFVCARRLL
jgi:gamma-D-glutamyl-L-lysine dipeptidyl-peptidase